jgi:hypothetical protein
LGSDKPPSVNLDGASFIYINAATLVENEVPASDPSLVDPTSEP